MYWRCRFLIRLLEHWRARVRGWRHRDVAVSHASGKRVQRAFVAWRRAADVQLSSREFRASKADAHRRRALTTFLRTWRVHARLLRWLRSQQPLRRMVSWLHAGVVSVTASLTTPSRRRCDAVSLPVYAAHGLPDMGRSCGLQHQHANRYRHS